MQRFIDETHLQPASEYLEEKRAKQDKGTYEVRVSVTGVLDHLVREGVPKTKQRGKMNGDICLLFNIIGEIEKSLKHLEETGSAEGFKQLNHQCDFSSSEYYRDKYNEMWKE